MKIKNNPLVALLEESILLKESAQKVLADAMGGKNLTRLERLILVIISESDVPLTGAQISRALGNSRQVVQRAANQLVDAGLLRKLRNPDHKGSMLFEATKKGLTFESDMGDIFIDVVANLLSEGEVKMCQRITKDLNKLRNRIENYRFENHQS